MDSHINELKAKGYFVARIDGKASTTKDAFLSNIGEAFLFPDHYGKNWDALNDCLNDLSWLSESNYALVIDHAVDLLSHDTAENKEIALNTLNETSHNWANVPNFEGEAAYRKKADFQVLLK